tara:strand:- start:239 stop:553 length:315 start_codon:yes stop_codon:yes gene_type:complete
MDTSGTWAKLLATTDNTTKMIGIALGGTITDGVLLRGFVASTNYSGLTGIGNKGKPLYASETTIGRMEIITPAATGDYVRIVGHTTATTNTIYFNPENTWVEIG